MGKIKIDDYIHAPAIIAGLPESYPSAMVSGRVVDISGKKLIITLPDGGLSQPIYKNLIRKKLGLFIVQIGDYHTEDTLLVPLRKSILHYSRLILTDDYIKCVSIRNTNELRYFWEQNHALMSHLILIAHGKSDSILFGKNNWVNAKELLSVLKVEDEIGEAKQIISLCCKTGGVKFGKVISGSQLCELFIGPSGLIHGANASQFYQTYLSYHFIHGYSPDRAYDYARVAMPGLTEFNLWRKTRMAIKMSKKEIFS